MSDFKLIEYTPQGVCSKKIEIEIENNIIKNITFIAGCSGNAQGVAALAKGMDVKEVISRLKGIDCKGKGTSCPDQLSKALEAYKK